MSEETDDLDPVERGAKALHASSFASGAPWEHLTPRIRESFMIQARAVLVAVRDDEAVDREALDLLDEMNAGGRILYRDYSRLHDLIAVRAVAAPTVTAERVAEYADRIESAGRVYGYAVAADLRALLSGEVREP